VSQQFFLPVSIHISNYDLKFILQALARMHRQGVADSPWVDSSFTYYNIPKSAEKLLLLEFKWQTVGNGHTCWNKIYFLDPYCFFPKALSKLIQVHKNDNFDSFPLLKQRFPDNEIYDLLTCKGIYACDY
jgi:hypothetical protein